MISTELAILLLIISFIIIGYTIRISRKYNISVRYTIVWYLSAAVLIFVACFTKLCNYISIFIGFEVTSNFVIGLFIILFIIMSFTFTISISNERRRTTTLIQEVSMLKNKIEELKK